MTQGERIAKHRKLAKMSQRELGNFLGGYTKATISRWENDVNDPSQEDLKKMSDIFNVSVPYLMGLTNDPDSISSNSEEFDLKAIKEALSKDDTELLWGGKPLPSADQEYLKKVLEPILERVIQAEEEEEKGNS